jgi:hypothetical protein
MCAFSGNVIKKVRVLLFPYILRHIPEMSNYLIEKIPNMDGMFRIITKAGKVKVKGPLKKEAASEKLSELRIKEAKKLSAHAGGARSRSRSRSRSRRSRRTSRRISRRTSHRRSRRASHRRSRKSSRR